MNVALSVKSVSSPTGASVAGTIRWAFEMGLTPFVVDWVPCSTFKLSTMNSTNAVYWDERWRLYRARYMSTKWLAANGVRNVEFWSEPDRFQSCVTLASWGDIMRINTAAMRAASPDVAIHAAGFAMAQPGSNSSVGNLWPVPGTKLYPNAFYSTQNVTSPYEVPGDYYAYLGAASLNYPFETMSVHTYSLDGPTITSSGVGSSPILSPKNWEVTETAAHTTADWDAIPTTADTPSEASRLAAQVGEVPGELALPYDP